MGYRPASIELDLPEFRDDVQPENSLRVFVLAPSIREGERMNGGQLEGETREDFGRVCWGYLVPKILRWTLEDIQGRPVALPSDVGLDIADPVERLAAQVEHLRDQDENVILAIFKAWRLASLTPKRDTPEGKDSSVPSTTGHDASPRNDATPDLRELEFEIPM